MYNIHRTAFFPNHHCQEPKIELIKGFPLRITNKIHLLTWETYQTFRTLEIFADAEHQAPLRSCIFMALNGFVGEEVLRFGGVRGNHDDYFSVGDGSGSRQANGGDEEGSEMEVHD